MKNAHKGFRFALIVMTMIVLMPAMAFASAPLYVSGGDVSGFRVYDSQGKAVNPNQMLDDGLYEGWILRTDDSVVEMGSPAGAIVMHPQSILGVSRLTYEDPVFYLVSGTAIFQTDEGFTGTLNVATPVSRYQVTGTSQILVSSDLGELIYSFGGNVAALNAITKQKTIIPSYHYLDMMIPLMEPKAINQQTYMSMAYNPDPAIVASLPGTPVQPAIVSVEAKVVEEVPATAVQVEPAMAPVEPVVPSAPTAKATVMPAVPATPATPIVTVVPKEQEEVPAAKVPSAPVILSGTIALKTPKAPAFSDIIGVSPMAPEAPVFSSPVEISPMAPKAPLFAGTAESKPLFPEAPVFESLPTINKPVPRAPVFTPTKISYYRPSVQPFEEPKVILEEPIAAKAVEEPVPVQETPVSVSAGDDKLTVRQPSGLISGVEPEKSRLDAGVALSYSLHYDGSSTDANVQPLSTIAVKPYFSYNTFKLGLRATLSSTGSLKWEDIGGTLKFDASSPLHTVASITSFIDYFKVGTASGKVYLNVDTTTPISFGVNSMMGGINHRFDKTSMLGFYNQVNTSWYGHQIYFDDLYLNDLLANNQQTGGVRFRFTPTQAYPFSIGISSLVVLSNPSTGIVVDMYPSLDFSFPLVNNRKLRMNLNIGGALYLQAYPDFKVSDIYDKDAATLLGKFPNFLANVGLDATFGGAKLGATVAFNRGKVVSNLINNTSYSGKPMTAGNILDLMLNGSYTANGFQIAGTWNLPFKLAGGLALAPLEGDATGRKADISSLELGYAGTAWSFGAGLQQIDMIGAYKTLFTGSGNASTKIGAFLDPDYTNVYAYAEYDAGAVRLDMKLSTAKATPGQTNIGIAPVLDLGMTMRLGTGTFPQFGESPLLTKESKVKISGSIGATYVNRRFSSTPSDKDSNDQMLFIKPVLLLDSDNFSMGIGINFGASLGYHTVFDPTSWYAPRGDKFWDFGVFNTGSLSTPQKMLDLVTDVFNLVEHMRIGKPLSSFYLLMDREQALTFAGGTLVDNILPNIEAPYFTALPLYNRLNTLYFGYELFIDDMTYPTLAGLAISAKPIAMSYPFKIGVSAVAQAKRPSYHDFRLYPTVDITLPIIYNKGLDSMSLGIHAATAAQLSKTNGNKFLLLDENKRLKNYLLSGSLDGTFGNFSFTLAGGVQSGILSYGMFDEYYLRRNTDFIGVETAARTFFGKAAFGYSSNAFSIHTGYIVDVDLPNFTSLSYVGDKFNIELKVSTSVVDVSAGFVKQNIFSEIKSMINTKPSIIAGMKTFFVNENAVAYGQLDVKAGLATVTGRISTTEVYDTDGNPTGTVTPALSMGVKIGF